jgi:RNA methyltransferase, TrmH family
MLSLLKLFPAKRIVITRYSLTPNWQKRYNTSLMITSFKNEKVKYVRRLQTERRFRWREQAFVVEGMRWLTELVQRQHPIEFVLCTASWLEAAKHAAIVQQLFGCVQTISDDLMADLTGVETPPGVLAVVKMVWLPWPTNPRLLLLLDGVGNPGNLGTILRTAAAAGVEGVILAPGCVDPYNAKALRGGMGAHLRLPLRLADWAEAAALMADLTIWLADVAEGLNYTAVNWQMPSALIIGGEAAGGGAEAINLANGRCTIPMYAATESLNAALAAGIILFEAARQRHRHLQDSASSL